MSMQKIKDLSQDRPKKGSARFRFVDIQLHAISYMLYGSTSATVD